jgi:hypothetical protein
MNAPKMALASRLPPLAASDSTDQVRSEVPGSNHEKSAKMKSYYPGGGVMIATEAGTIYAELSADDKLDWSEKRPEIVESVERELLRRGLDQRKNRYRVIDNERNILASGMISELRDRYAAPGPSSRPAGIE